MPYCLRCAYFHRGRDVNTGFFCYHSDYKTKEEKSRLVIFASILLVTKGRLSFSLSLFSYF